MYPVYSNPWYMRVMSATYVGNMMKDANMTHWGNVWASEAITEFDRHGTLSEVSTVIIIRYQIILTFCCSITLELIRACLSTLSRSGVTCPRTRLSFPALPALLLKSGRTSGSSIIPLYTPWALLGIVHTVMIWSVVFAHWGYMNDSNCLLSNSISVS